MKLGDLRHLPTNISPSVGFLDAYHRVCDNLMLRMFIVFSLAMLDIQLSAGIFMNDKWLEW